MAREIEQQQWGLGEASIASIKFDLQSRDDIPKILPNVDKKNGRPGMALWKILVLGVLRLDLNCDYDRLRFTEHVFAICHL